MSFYSFGRIKILSRGKTKSAVATAAYHSASKMINEWDGVTHDFTKKRNVGDSFLRLPENAPEELKNESIPVKERLEMLWNSVEKFETSLDAQLARQNYLALPHDMTLEQGLECVERFIKENCTDIGMGVSYSIHHKPGNLHVDMMYLMREFDKNGNFKAKSKKGYICRNKNGQEKTMLPDVFNARKGEGWEKIYKCKDQMGKTRWLTPSEMEREGAERLSKNPKSIKVEVNNWNNHELAKKWRKSWEVILNEKYAELDMNESVDCRSYKEQGINKIPTLHVGWGAGAEERRSFNVEATAFNNEISKLEEQGIDALNTLSYQIKDLEHTHQTPETLSLHQNLLDWNIAILKALSESELFNDKLVNRFRKYMDKLRSQIIKLMDLWRKKLSLSDSVPKSSPEPIVPVNSLAKNALKETRKTLDSMINNALKNGASAPQHGKFSEKGRTSNDRNNDEEKNRF